MKSLVDELIIELDNSHLLKKIVKRPPKPKALILQNPKTIQGSKGDDVKGRDLFDLLTKLLEYGILKKLMPANFIDLKGGQNGRGAQIQLQTHLKFNRMFLQIFYGQNILQCFLCCKSPSSNNNIYGKKKTKKKKVVPLAPQAKSKKPLQDLKKVKFIEPTSKVVFKVAELMIMMDRKNFFEKKLLFPMLNYDTRLNQQNSLLKKSV